MVLKGLNWVHNNKIGSNGLKRSQLGTQYKYRGYLLRQVRNLWISVFNVVLLKVELEMWFMQFLRLNLPENCSFHQNLWFSSKSTIFIKICSFFQNPQFSSNLRFSSKSTVFIKIHNFHQNPQFSSKSMFFDKSAVFIKICGFHQNP